MLIRHPLYSRVAAARVFPFRPIRAGLVGFPLTVVNSQHGYKQTRDWNGCVR